MKQRKLRVLLSMLLAFCMILSAVMPVAADGAELLASDSGVGYSTNTRANAENPYRIVMLDCGRKYFSVDNIKKLIDTMAQYGYNQLQLSFGNGGCRFLLDDMELSFADGSNTVTISSDAVKSNITAGNKAFNGDDRYLDQNKMDEIIEYAASKNIEIVPMLNMPGHATAIVYDTSYTSNGNLNVNDATSRNYGYALLKKYVDYFKDKGCKYFHFGSDESGFSGDNMTAFLTGCAEIITDAGMTPRAFNDATNVANMPKNVQITYWHKENGSKTASALNNDGYSLINTHGRWYYVIKTAQNSETDTKYWQGTVNSTETSVELPVKKAEKMDNYWVGINQFFDDSIKSGSTISDSLGTMFCIWCDASEDAYLTDSDVISDNENYGALYQLKKLAEHYWLIIATEDGNSIPRKLELDKDDFENCTFTFRSEKELTWTIDNTNVLQFETVSRAGASVTGTTATVKAVGSGNATVTATDGELSSTYNFTVTADENSGSGEENNKESVSVVVGASENIKIEGYNYSDNVDRNSLNTSIAEVEVTGVDSSEGSTTYEYTEASNVKCNSIISSDEEYVSTNYYYKVGEKYYPLYVSRTSQYYYIYYYYYYYYDGTEYKQIGETQQVRRSNISSTNITPTVYTRTETTIEPVEGYTSIKITGVGEGNTTVTVGETTYKITVTAPEETKTANLNFGGSFTPEGTDITITSGNDIVSIEDGKIVAGNTAGTATVTSVTKNAGGYVTKRYMYNVTVKMIELDGVEPLNVQLWITNTWVGENEAPDSLQTVDIKASEANVEDGVLLKDLIPYNGYKKDGSNTVKVIYWKGTVLETAPVQQGTDLSGLGDDFTLVRYWNDAWQYYGENGWTNVSNNYVVAYYLQINNVSPEITTGTKDYGNPPTSHPGTNSGNGYAMTAFAVVYPDGTLSRTEQEMYETGMIRGFWGSTSFGIGLVYAENNSTYKVSKMTATWGTNILGTSGDNWYSANKNGTYGVNWGVKWNKTTNSAGEEWYDETTYWEYGDSEIPTIDSDKYDLNFNTTDHHAVLILIYLETVETDDSLNVIYWDDNANTQILTNDIFIDVKNGTTFYDGLKQSSSIPSTDNVRFTLDNNAYITNSSDSKQGFNTVISTVPGVTGVYLSGLYKFDDAEIRNEGKTLVLHFTLNYAEAEKTYVFDFCLPFTITMSDFMSGLDIDLKNIKSISLEKNGVALEKQGTYGLAKISDDYSAVTYELNSIFNSVKATIPLWVTMNGSENSQALLYQIHLLPASNIYYEETFLTNNSGWESIGTATPATQKAEKLGESGNYGYDPAYENSSTYSNGSALRAEVYVAMPVANRPTASFTFTGTGFDIVSECSDKTGVLFVRVTDNDGNYEESYLVDTYFKGDNNILTPGSTMYQIPVVRSTDSLKYGTHNVTITGVVFSSSGVSTLSEDGYGVENIFETLFELGITDEELMNMEFIYMDENSILNGGSGASMYAADGTSDASTTSPTTAEVYVDGFRVYNTLTPQGERTTSSQYSNDAESGFNYVSVYENLIGGSEYHFYVETDGNIEATADNITDYKKQGPENEVYIVPGAAIAFKLDNSSVASIQISAKSLNGTEVDLNGNKIKSNTEMYYNISKTGDYFVISNTNGTGVLAVSEIKMPTGTATAMIDVSEQPAVLSAINTLRMSAPTEPVKPVEPEVPAEPEIFEPDYLEVYALPVAFRKIGSTITVTSSVEDGMEVYIESASGEETLLTPANTRMVEWGITDKYIYTYKTGKLNPGSYTYSVYAVKDGVRSESVEITFIVW